MFWGSNSTYSVPYCQVFANSTDARVSDGTTACVFLLFGREQKKILSVGFLVEMINLHENTLYGYSRPHNVDEDPKKQALPDRLSKAADTDYVVGIIHTPGPDGICIL